MPPFNKKNDQTSGEYPVARAPKKVERAGKSDRKKRLRSKKALMTAMQESIENMPPKIFEKKSTKAFSKEFSDEMLGNVSDAETEPMSPDEMEKMYSVLEKCYGDFRKKYVADGSEGGEIKDKAEEMLPEYLAADPRFLALFIE